VFLGPWALAFASIMETFSFLAWIDGIKRSNTAEEFRLNAMQTILNGLLSLIPAVKTLSVQGTGIKWLIDVVTTMFSNPFAWAGK
jgi:uncharacterized membrane protein